MSTSANGYRHTRIAQGGIQTRPQADGSTQSHASGRERLAAAETTDRWFLSEGTSPNDRTTAKREV